MKLKLFKVTQKENNDYDTYNSIIVCAIDKARARVIYPSVHCSYVWKRKVGWVNEEEVKVQSDNWANELRNTRVVEIGIATENMKEGVVLASYNAG